MKISPEMIDLYERTLEAQRKARGSTKVPILLGIAPVGDTSRLVTPASDSYKPEIPRPIITKGDEQVEVRVTAVHHLEGEDIFAQELRLERTRISGTDHVVVSFDPPVKVDNEGIYLGVPMQEKGRARFKKGLPGQPFDPWLPFSGKKEDRKLLRVLGVKLKKL